MSSAIESSSNAAEADASGCSTSFSDRMADRMKKLRELHTKRNESRALNHAEVVEEDRRKNEPKNMEARRKRAEYILKEEEFKRECEAQGKDFERERLRHVGADDADLSEKRKRAKHNPDEGFSSFEAATARKYNQLAKQIKPDMSEYERTKERAGDAFYATSGTVVHGVHKDSKAAIERMAEDVKKQVEKREKYSRRRMHNDDEDINYINDRNAKFNKKLERFYGQYTKDIKKDIERGTAV